MKKALVLLLLCALAAPLFADDALVLPARVIRIYVVPTYAFQTGGWDADGEYTALDEGEGAISTFNLGLAVEYGVNDWITAAVQWTPAWNVWSAFDTDAAPLDEANINGPWDIFAGAKLQILGEKAPVVNEKMRFAVAPGVKIPLPGADAEKEFDKMMDGDPWTASDPDKHAFGFGARFFFDYIINEMFFANLYSEFIYYPEKKYGDKALAYADQKVKYGYDLTLEAEPQLQMPIGEGMRFEAGLPVTYELTPDLEVEGVKQDDSATSVLYLKPNVALFLMKTPVPLEFKATYRWPLLGDNTRAIHALSLECRVYMKF